jgi:signal transduction histidine kinase
MAGLDLLAGLLLVVALMPPTGWAWAAGAAFATCWVVVRLRVRVLGEPMDARGGSWLAVAAASGLLACYVLVLAASASGMWLAFPVMLLQLHLLGPRSGVVAVTLTTVAAVVLGAVSRGEADLGYVLGPVVGSLARIVADRQRALDDLEDAQQRLLAAERDRLRAQERANLARDIHDTLAQDFAAVELHLRRAATLLAPGDPAAPSVALAQQATAEGLAQARRFLAGGPGHRMDATLLGAVRHAAERAQADSGGRTLIEVRAMGSEPALSADLATGILRMTQSALSNVVRHADATSAAVTLTWEPDRVLLDIVDDGRGFDPDGHTDTTGGGFGLPSMRSRVRDLGGTFGFESQPGEGTAIAITLPLGSEPG